MASATLTVTVHANLVLFNVFVRALGLLGPVIGWERALAIAKRYGPRLVLIRFDRGRWHFMPTTPTETDPIAVEWTD